MKSAVEITASPLLQKLWREQHGGGQDYLQRATSGSAGFDLLAVMETNIVIEARQHKLIPTGIFMKMPRHLLADIRPRSGLALKQGLTVLNSPGTIDSDYRGEVGVIMQNHSDQAATIIPLQRIAQMVFLTMPDVTLSVVSGLSHDDETTEKKRGQGGFGSTDQPSPH